MLYLRGVVDDFNDIDIMISLNDVEKVKQLLIDYPLDKKYENSNYKTKVFLEYTIDSVEVDIMAGFSIVSDNEEHYFPLDEKNVKDHILIDGTKIYLESINEWLKYYRLMKREDKVKQITEFLDKNKTLIIK